jgi:hypothetical protein
VPVTTPHRFFLPQIDGIGVEKSKETYYEVLQDSSINWYENAIVVKSYVQG